MSTFGSESLPGNGAGFYALGLAALIPGYGGYGRREARRNADRELRRYIVGRMNRLKGTLAEQPGATGLRQDAVDAVRRLDELVRKIDEAGTGLESFFNTGDLSEPDVDAIHAYDRRIIDHLDAMDAAGAAASGDWGRHLDELERLVSERTGAMDQVRG